MNMKLAIYPVTGMNSNHPGEAPVIYYFENRIHCTVGIKMCQEW